jgi:hypothetical protein
MPDLIAVVLCLAVVATAELARFGVARGFRLATTRVAKLFVAPHGGPRPARALAIFAGTVATYLGAALLAFVFYTCAGIPTRYLECTIVEVPAGYPSAGKLEPGDRMVAIDGEPIDRSPSSIIDAKGGAPVRFTIVRRGETRDVTIRPIGHDGHWMIGFRPRLERARSYDLAFALRRSFASPLERAVGAIALLAPKEEADPGGPKRIIEEFSYGAPLSVVEQGLALAMLMSGYLLLLTAALDLARIIRAVTRR